MSKSNISCGRTECYEYMRNLEEVYRCELLIHYCFDRMNRKYDMLNKLFRRSYFDWNQTFYHMMLRMLDVGPNRKLYEKLATIVNYNAILHEKCSLKSLEALFIGAAGLLPLYKVGTYAVELDHEAMYLMRKHNITPLDGSEWQLHHVRPQNHPIPRLLQLASFYSKHDFVTNEVMACRTPQDVERLFAIDRIPYWKLQISLNGAQHDLPDRIGCMKAQLLGINIIVPMQLLYSAYTFNDELHDNAITLLEALEPESNIYTRMWAAHGIKARDAAESQALLQISTEYCMHNRCSECLIGQQRGNGRGRLTTTEE